MVRPCRGDAGKYQDLQNPSRDLLVLESRRTLQVDRTRHGDCPQKQSSDERSVRRCGPGSFRPARSIKGSCQREGRTDDDCWIVEEIDRAKRFATVTSTACASSRSGSGGAGSPPFLCSSRFTQTMPFVSLFIWEPSR